MSEQKLGEMIPVKDAAGNPLVIGGLVVYTAVKNLNHLIGKVTGYDPGGLSIVDSNDKGGRQTPARVRISFEMIVALMPGQPAYLAEYYRIINPEQELVIEKALEKVRLS